MTLRADALGPRDFVAALAVVVIWGLNFVAMKIALKAFTPFQLGALRYLIAVLPLVLVLRPPRLAARWVLLYGLCQGVGQFGFLFVALQVGMTAALASVLMQTQVFFTALLGVVLLGERLSVPLRLGLGLAALGLASFAMNYVAPAGGAAVATTALGFVLNLAAASMWAISNIVARRAQQASAGYDPLAFVVWSSLVPILPFVLFAWMFDPPQARWHWTSAPWTAWLAAAYLGWIATLLAYALWTGLLQRHAASRVAPFSLGVPVIGIAAGMLALGEAVTAWQWAGVLLVVSALASVLLGPRLHRRTSRAAAPGRSAPSRAGDRGAA